VNITTRPIGTQAGDRSHRTRNRQSGKRNSNDLQYTSRPESVRINTDLSQERRRDFTVNRNAVDGSGPQKIPHCSKKQRLHQTIAFLRALAVGLDKGINARRLHSSLDRKTMENSVRAASPSLRVHSTRLCLSRARYIGSVKNLGRIAMTENETEKTTHFGARDVREDEKAGLVHDVFTNVASKYDVMNDVMSVGVHRLWKEAMMDWLAPRSGQRLLDVAGGTGDISFRFLKRAKSSEAVVLDLTESMLTEGRKRAEASEMSAQLDWVTGDAMALPFEDNSFDVYTISFGIRNVTRIPDALSEAYRVLRPGGRLMVLEFSQLPVDGLQRLYDLYSFNVIPRMGQLIARDRDSYQYLVESIRKFPDQAKFADMIEAAGFGQVKFRNLSMGIAALHSGWKI